MIQHIKCFIFLILIFGNFSCKQEKKNTVKNKITDSVTLAASTSVSKVKNFGFYKSFAFCDSEVGYFSQSEADSIYSDKTFNINIDKLESAEISTLYSAGEWKCIKESLALNNFIAAKKVKTDEAFPFDNMILINDKYLIVPRDGYFFVFVEYANIDISQDREKYTNNTTFKNIYNTKLVGLSVLNYKEKNIFKKYSIDFTSQCLCNSPSIYINKQKNELILFNYCDSDKNLSEVKNKYTFNISKTNIDKERLVFTTKENIRFIFIQTDNGNLFKIDIEGKIPKDYIGNDMKIYFTSQPEKYKKEDCGEYGG